MSAIDLGDDDGLAGVTINGVTLDVDIWKVNNQLAAYHKESQGKGQVAYDDGLAALIQGLGFPAVSHRMAQRFSAAVAERVVLLAKKDCPPAA
jgi:hypothetical protein